VTLAGLGSTVLASGGAAAAAEGSHTAALPLYATIIIVILVAVLLAVVRAVKGPELVDRVLAVNVVGTNTVVVIALIGFLYGRPAFLDLALIYAIINFIATIAFLKFVEKGRLG